MIKKGVLSDLTKNNKMEVIEKHLVYSFIKNNHLAYQKSAILNAFFSNFSLKSKVFSTIKSLELKEIKTLENYLELLIPKKDRKLNGAFFTPNYVIDFIIGEVAPQENEKCLDPSCGCGAFLIGLVDYFKNKFQKSVRAIVQENIFGADILAYNIERTKIILSIYGLLNGEIIEESDFNLYHQDSLKGNWKRQFEVIVGNPPYVKYQDLLEENRQDLIHNWQTIKNGTFNLYFAFFELGYQLLTPQGRLGYITPNNYFTSLAGLSLRKFFMSSKCVCRIVDFRHKKVFDAQTYTAITFLDKKQNDTILYDKIKDSQATDDFLVTANGSHNYVAELQVKKWRLLKTDEQINIKQIETIGTPLKKLFNIAVGIATLKDEVFFVDGASEQNHLLTKTTEKGTFFIEKAVTKPVYKISKFKSQAAVAANTLRIITPYYEGTSKPIAEAEFKENFPHCYAYLLTEKEKLQSRDKGKKVFKPFFEWGRTQGITRRGKKILNPTFSKHPRFLLVEEEDAYYTNGYGIYFYKNQSGNLFESSIHPFAKEANRDLVQKVLNSIVMDYYITKTSVSIQGGYPCYQKNFIEKFTIPEFTDQELSTLRNLSDKGEIDSFLVEKYNVVIQTPNLAS